MAQKKRAEERGEFERKPGFSTRADVEAHLAASRRVMEKATASPGAARAFLHSLHLRSDDDET